MSLERFTRKRAVTIAPEAKVVTAAELMESQHVGALVVVEGGRPVGIVTDRDLALRVLGRGLGADVTLAEVMTPEPVAIHVDAALDEALFTMRRSGVRRLPIIGEGGTLIGLVSLDDLLVLLSGELSSGVEAVLENRGP